MDTLSHHAQQGNQPPLKTCSKCKKTYPATPEFFQRNRAAKDGFRPDCKPCRVDFGATRKEYKQAYNQSYYADEEKRSHILSQRKEKYHSDPIERQRALDYNKQPRVREYQKEYLKEYNQRPDIKERDRTAKRIAKKNRRAHVKEIGGSFTQSQIADLLIRQKRMCYYCRSKFEKRDGKYVYHVEHTYPINRVKGTDIPANDISYIVLACPSCNHKKSDKFPWEFPEGGRLL